MGVKNKIVEQNTECDRYFTCYCDDQQNFHARFYRLRLAKNTILLRFLYSDSERDAQQQIRIDRSNELFRLLESAQAND
jgi:hypothetical protein